MRKRLNSFLVLAVLGASSLAALAQQVAAPSATPTNRPAALSPAPTSEVDVTEWAIFIADATESQLNRRENFDDCLPEFVHDLRKPAVNPGGPLAPQTPGPVGVIRIHPAGKIPTDFTMDVQLSLKSGRALGHWPTAKLRTQSLLWQDITLPATSTSQRALSERQWLNDLRQGSDQLLTVAGTSEPYLLYDVELNYPARLEVRGPDAGKYRIWHTMDAPMLDLTLYKKDPNGHWRTALLPELKKSQAASSATVSSASADTKSTAPGTADTTYVLSGTNTTTPLPNGGRLTVVGTGTVTMTGSGGPAPAAPATQAAANSQPSTQPAVPPGTTITTTQTITVPPNAVGAAGATVVVAGPGGAVVQRRVGANGGTITFRSTQPGAVPATQGTVAPAPAAEMEGTPLTFGDATATDDSVLQPWRAKLAAAGVTPGDQAIALKILAQYALDPKRMTAIYRLDPAELDKMLPLEIVPQPRKISRIGLVVVRGFDPALGTELDELIAQLGDPSWEKRVSAMEEIKKLGAFAKPKLIKATTNKDMEIVMRAEQLLQAINGPVVQQQN